MPRSAAARPLGTCCLCEHEALFHDPETGTDYCVGHWSGLRLALAYAANVRAGAVAPRQKTARAAPVPPVGAHHAEKLERRQAEQAEKLRERRQARRAS